MRATFLLLLFFTRLLTAYAQTKSAPERQQILDGVGNNNSQAAVQTFDERYEGVRGTPFLSDQWAAGTVTLRDGKVHDKVQLKYDAYQDELVVKHPYDRAVIPDKLTITQFVLDSAQTGDSLHFVFVSYLPNNRKFPSNHFAQVLYGSFTDSQNSTLLATHTRKLIKADYEGAYSADRRYDAFGPIMTSYYLIKPNGQTERFKPTQRAVRRLFKDKKKAIDEFMTVEAINPEYPSDLVRLIEYYDQL
ncbi:MAG: hypothetical protein WA958_19970 [Tunicatimonas sp.]